MQPRALFSSVYSRGTGAALLRLISLFPVQIASGKIRIIKDKGESIFHRIGKLRGVNSLTIQR